MGEELQARDVNWKVAALGVIEYRIRQRKENITHEFYAIGDDLLEARDRGVVPHGHWETWATEVTGLNIRTVQRLMQAAREVPPEKRLGSLGQLEFRQLSEVLALPEGEREELADRAQAEHMSTREIAEAVQKAREEARAEAMASVRKATEESNADTERIIAETKQTYAALVLEKEKRIEKLTKDLERQRKGEEAAKQTQEALEAQLEALRKATADSPKDAEQEAEIQRLQRELNTAQNMAREQARMRQDAQQQLLAAQSHAARNAADAQPATGLTVGQFSDAARAFVGKCGALPYMRAQLAAIPKREREEWESAVAMVQTLLDGARDALNMVDGGVLHA